MTNKLRYLLIPFIEAYRGFIKDDCTSKASSLTFYTLLSIVPLLAVAFGIAKGFGFEYYLEKVVSKGFLDQPEVTKPLISFAYSALNQAHGGVLATVGLISLLWTSVQLFSSVEHSLNEIWEVKAQRSYTRQLRDYLAIIILAPIFFALSSSFSVYASAHLTQAFQETPYFETISAHLLILFRLSPFVFNWLFFSFMYIYIPNTTVQWKYAIIGGVIAGTIYQIASLIYIHFQIGVLSYGAIYGSFAALPLFLIWLNLSWIIVLIGAELAYHLEISTSHDVHGLYQMATKKLIGLAIIAYCCENFLKGNPPVTITQITHEVGAPVRVIRYIIDKLTDTQFLIKDQKNTFLPARNPATVSIKEILDALEETEIKYPVRATAKLKSYEHSIEQLDELIVKSSLNLSLSHILQKNL